MWYKHDGRKSGQRASSFRWQWLQHSWSVDRLLHGNFGLLRPLRIHKLR
jgi:hypothetical protein